MSDFETDLRAFARERVTVDDTAGGVTLTASLYENHADLGTTSYMKAKVARIVVEGTNNIYLTETGVAPSATAGITLEPGEDHIVRGVDGMRKIRMLQVSGAGEAEVVYYR